MDVEKIFKCIECDKIFENNTKLKRHRSSRLCKSHENYRSMKEARKEYRKKKIIKPGKCPQCNKTFARDREVRRHIASVHEGKKPFSCDICNDRFTSKHGLQYHVVLKHDLKGQNIDELNL